MSIDQAEYIASGAGHSQCDRILARLRETPGDWVSEPELLRISGSHAVHARIGDLRKRGKTQGFEIENRTSRVPRHDGRFSMHSEYRLNFIEQP